MYILYYRQYNKNIIKLSMSACHFPHDNYTIILDVPSISHINNSLRLIETNNHLPDPSIMSLAFLDKPNQITRDLLRDQDDQDSLGLAIQQREEEEQADPVVKKKKTGCTCKKTKCLKMYCQCFSIGKMCTEDCACYGCHNHSQCESLIQKAKMKIKSSSTNRHNNRGCNCKKTNCQKKYCECYNAGLACTEACNCCDCCNKEKEQKCNEHSIGQDS